MTKQEQKANDLVNEFRVILMDEDTDCGNEILCTLIAQKHASIVCNEVIRINTHPKDGRLTSVGEFYREVKKKIQLL